MKLNERTINTVCLADYELQSCQRHLQTLPLESIVVYTFDNRSFDVGALCYTNRFIRLRAAIKSVDLSTHRPERVAAVRRWIEGKVTTNYTRGSLETTQSNLVEFGGFAVWCDTNGHEDFLTSPQAYHYALKGYSLHLVERIRKGEIKPFTGNRLQSEPLKSGALIFPQTRISFSADMPIISNRAPDVDNTQIPTDEKMAQQLSVSEELFKKLSNFVLENCPFPYQLSFAGEMIWLLPGEFPFITSAYSALRKGKVANNIFWDYEKGCVRTLAECIPLSLQKPYYLERQILDANNLLRSTNANPKHEKRLRLAKLAHDAFVCLFAANTGYSEKQIRDLPWENDYEVGDAEKLGFCVIKLRAGGKLINIEITKVFLKSFRAYLKLRSYICGETAHPYLFVGSKVHRPEELTQLRMNTLKSLNDRIRTFIDPNFVSLGYRELRAYKSNFMLSRGNDVETVALVMQNSPGTVRRSYSQAEEKTAIDEISAMLNRLASLLNDYSGEPNAAGDCSDRNKPITVGHAPDGYIPDCKNLQGCIFCVHFQTHADEQGIHKLLSMRFVVSRHISLTENAQHFETVHGAALNRLDEILALLKRERPDMIGLITQLSEKVEKEFSLTPYWNRMYARLYKLGVMH
ncbi:hypothetical protein [Pseudomonas sp. FEN]|uniref:hypothetical protein n=1 Tax=Pseudomonas sp. FEN TaxID=2767468 RepID=UPI00174C1E82|nr:hypothetical protein [Pseudomonas sp. FEN]